jgi:hypothetical protein
MATRIGTNWEGIPHTRATANIVELRKVEGVRVVRIDNGSFRNASVSGYFELAAADTRMKVDKSGNRTIEVKLGWFGVKAPTSWASVTIAGEYKILENFTGAVFHNISGTRRVG